MCNSTYSIVSFPFNPSLGFPPNDTFPDLVIYYYKQRIGKSRYNSVILDRFEPQGCVNTRTIHNQTSQSHLEYKCEIEIPVGHTLLKQRKFPGLANYCIGNLGDDDPEKICGHCFSLQHHPFVVGPLLAIRIL